MQEDNISKKKPNYPINSELRKYLKGYGRKFSADMEYNDLLRFTSSFPYYDKKGKDTLWETVYFSPSENHNFRASYQTGFRNPTVPDQFIKLNVGPIIILGGAPANSAGLNAYENSFTAASVGAFASGFSSDLKKGVYLLHVKCSNSSQTKKVVIQ